MTDIPPLPEDLMLMIGAMAHTQEAARPLLRADIGDAIRSYAEEAVRLEREAAKPLIDAAEKALHEMCHTNSPRESFTDAVDALDAAITAIRARSEVKSKEE